MNKQILTESIQEALKETINITAQGTLTYDADIQLPIKYSDEELGDASVIFVHVMFNKMWELQEKEGMSKEERGNMVIAAGKELNKLVKTYTGVDTKKIYK